jgi:hypothetical protein
MPGLIPGSSSRIPAELVDVPHIVVAKAGDKEGRLGLCYADQSG